MEKSETRVGEGRGGGERSFSGKGSTREKGNDKKIYEKDNRPSLACIVVSCIVLCCVVLSCLVLSYGCLVLSLAVSSAVFSCVFLSYVLSCLVLCFFMLSSILFSVVSKY
jgi:hypothetical protein